MVLGPSCSQKHSNIPITYSSTLPSQSPSHQLDSSQKFITKPQSTQDANRRLHYHHHGHYGCRQPSPRRCKLKYFRRLLAFITSFLTTTPTAQLKPRACAANLNQCNKAASAGVLGNGCCSGLYCCGIIGSNNVCQSTNNCGEPSN